MRSSVLTVLSTAATAAAASSCSAAFFATLLPANASVNYVDQLPQNGTFGDNNPAFPANASSLPPLCVASIHVVSSPTSSFNFALFLPDTWSGKFWTTGNGGLSGGIDWQPMGVFTQYGAAALSTDTGHLSGTEDGTWALNAPERIVDWAWRAMHESVVLSKHLITSYYARDIEHSYYAACSTGGRQGLKEIEEFPADFDGIVVGAAAWWFTNLPAATVQLGKVNLPETADYHIPSNLWQPIVDEMIRQCDPQDGVTDGIVSDPYRCNFYAENLLCTPGKDPSACLQPAQMDTLHKIYSDYVDTNQTLVYPALTLGSSAFLLGGGENGAPLGVGLSWIQNAVYNDSNWPWQDFDFSTVQLLQLKDPGNSTADNFDLSAFRARGGKVIMYHGLADFLIPTGSSLTFYQKVTQTLAPRGIDLDDFFKFYLIPGMGHCSGADTAAWYVGAAYQTGISGLTHGVPGYEDSKHDILLALQDWVENGDAPEEIIGTKFKNEDVSQGVERQRPLCPYPKQAKYCGTGDLDQPDNWSCEYLY